MPWHCLRHIWHSLVTDLDSMLVEQLGQGVIRGEGSVKRTVMAIYVESLNVSIS